LINLFPVLRRRLKVEIFGKRILGSDLSLYLSQETKAPKPAFETLTLFSGDGSPNDIPRALKKFTERRLPDVRAIQALNARNFFPRTSVARIKFLGTLAAYKALPFLVGT
jgi:hypothetical protein